MTINVDPMFSEAVAGVIADEFGTDKVREWESGTAHMPEIWETFEQMGLLDIAIPEESGGAGGEIGDVVEVLRLASANALPIPYAEHALLAGQWLSAFRRFDSGMAPTTVSFDTEALEITGTVGARVVHGTARRVPWAGPCRRLLAVSRQGNEHVLLLLEASQVTLVPGRNIANEPRATVVVDDLAVDESAVIGPVDPLAWKLSGALARAISISGAAQRALDLSIEYVKVRQQFGRPLGKFQAVGHMLALAAEETAAARMASEAAVLSLSTHGRTLPLTQALRASEVAIAAAKVVASRNASVISRLTHQMHGAMGTTVEYDLQLFTRRLWSWQDEFGSGRSWAEHLGRRAISAGGSDLWGLISG